MDQSVMTLAGTAARGSAIATPVEGMVTYLEDSNSLQLWDGASWTAAGGVSSGNFLDNGAMQVAQRGTATSSITSGGYYTADRFTFSLVGLGTWTQTIENDAPAGSGFAKSLKILCTTADNTPAAGDEGKLQQAIEGQNLQAVRKGTSSAQQLTLSFWVKSNVTGTYIAELVDTDNSRQVSAAYTIAASATWEKKTVVFPADTTGVLDNDNNASFRLNFTIGAGTDFTSGTLNTTWASTTNANRYVGQVNLAASTNNYWQITGVQLELGNVASDFDFQDSGAELAACQRYFAVLGAGAVGRAYTATDAQVFLNFPISMRAAPTVTLLASFTFSEIGVASRTCTAISSAGMRAQGGSLLLTSSGLTAPNMVGIASSNSCLFDAEL
jgi:hypothetical protein